MLSDEEVRELNAQVPELWGTVRVAEQLGVAPGNLDRLSGLPEPVVQAGRRLWRADVVRDYAKSRKKGGR